jgi:hypothetical protein
MIFAICAYSSSTQIALNRDMNYFQSELSSVKNELMLIIEAHQTKR